MCRLLKIRLTQHSGIQGGFNGFNGFTAETDMVTDAHQVHSGLKCRNRSLDGAIVLGYRIHLHAVTEDQTFES